MISLEQLKKILVDEVGVEESKIKPEASFKEDLSMDSLDLVELLMALEEKFGIQIPDEDAQNLLTVQDAIDYLKKKGVV